MSVIPDSPKPLKKQKAPPKQRKIVMNKPAAKPRVISQEIAENISHSEISNNYFHGIVPPEIAQNAKGGILKLAAMPAGPKRDIMYYKLAGSKFTNEFLNAYLHFDILAGLNDYIKAFLTYGVLYLETMTYQPPTPEQTTDKKSEPN